MIDASASLWSRPTGERSGEPLIVLLHGYGADEHDLFGLVPYLPKRAVVAAVAAPLSPPFPMPGRSWYPIEGLENRDAERITAAGEALLAWLDAEAADAGPVVLFGFSQGAAVSLQALRLDPSRFAAVVALSGYAAEGELPGDAALRDVRPPVFWGRGSHDAVIPRQLIEHTARWLPGHADLSERLYSGLTHGISEDELRDVRAFIDRALSPE